MSPIDWNYQKQEVIIMTAIKALSSYVWEFLEKINELSSRNEKNPFYGFCDTQKWKETK